jgi:Spy/CpxP family protein refolding chaperone
VQYLPINNNEGVNMTEASNEPKTARQPRSLETEIATQRDKLKKLEERQRNQQRKERDRNTKSVLDMIRAEKLDMVSPDIWKNAMKTIKDALLITHN